MKRNLKSQRLLPTPRQIARDPEVAICRGVELHCELALRSLIAAHPELDADEIVYWAGEPSETHRAARDIVALTIKLQAAIEVYFRALDIEHQARAADFDDELPF